jgi:HK97 family phage major capsid protein
MNLPKNVQARQARAASFDRSTVDREARTCELAFSSEEPVERWWGVEILGHAAGEMDQAWIGGGTAPLLMDHNTRDQIGVVESVTLGADRKARATVRFSKSTRAEEIMQDVADGIRGNVSVGYELLELRLEKEEKGKPPVYRAIRWNPLEVSFVAVPADQTVGAGRDADPTIPAPKPKEMVRMDPTNEPAPPRAPTPDEINAAAQKRTKDFLDLAALANARDKAFDALGRGITIEQFRGELLESRGPDKPLVTPPSQIGLSEKEIKQYSLARYLLARAENNSALAPLEWEAARAAGEALTKAGFQLRNGTAMPFEIMNAPIPNWQTERGRLVVGPDGRYQRDLSTGSTGAGGAMVETTVLAPNFIELLRNSMMVRAMGATILSGLQGNIAIPRQTGPTTAGWVAEAGAASESDMTFSQVTMAPKTVHAIQDFTRQLLMQGSPDIEGLVRADLALVIALAIDLASLHGTGASNQPTGLAATAGIGSVAGGTNGAVPTWDNIVDLETQVANQNAAVDSLGYLTNSRVRGRLKRAQIVSGQPVFIWGGMPGFGSNMPGTTPVGRMSVMNEYAAGVSNQVSNTLTKGTASGVCSAIFFGNWRDLLIGEWGGLETLVDNVTQAANRIIRVHAYQTADVAVRKPQSFAAMLDALTT